MRSDCTKGAPDNNIARIANCDQRPIFGMVPGRMLLVMRKVKPFQTMHAVPSTASVTSPSSRFTRIRLLCKILPRSTSHSSMIGILSTERLPTYGDGSELTNCQIDYLDDFGV